jgi:glycosyltransferase involved in cell wall biosynthesis
MAKEESNPAIKEAVSIVVPCLNEEHYIGTLLACLARQTFQNFEVVIVDGYSSDDTKGAVDRAVSSHASLSGKVSFVRADKGVSHQRNAGVLQTSHERLLFLDADVQIPDSFLEAMLGEIEKQDLELATAIFEPISDRVDDKIFYYIGNIYIQLQQFLRPVAMGFCIFSTKQRHEALGGFDEGLRLGEDFDYVHRAAKQDVRLKVLTCDRVYVSIRRLRKEGRFTYYRKAVLSEMLKLVMDKKEVAEAIEYDFGNHTEAAK